MSTDNANTKQTNAGATEMLDRLLKFEFIVFLQFWASVLPPIDAVQKKLQRSSITFREAAEELKTLQARFAGHRDEIICESMENGQRVCAENEVEVEKSVRSARGLTRKENARRVMVACLDRLELEMRERFCRLNELDDKFGFLLDVKSLFDTDVEDLQAKCDTLANHLIEDISAMDLMDDIKLCKTLLTERDKKSNTPLDLLKFIVSFGDQSVMPN